MPKRRASLPNATKGSPAKRANTATEMGPVIDLTQQNIPTPPTNIVPDYDPLIATNEAGEEEEREEVENFRILDTLAWLLETNTSDCVALTVVESESGNCRLLIATNSIYANARRSNQSAAYMDEVLNTLANFAAEEMTQDEEKELVINIFEKKLRGAYKGGLINSLSSHTIAALKNLINTCYDNTADGETPQISPTANDQFTSSILQTSAAITLANRILRRFYRVKNQLNNNTLLKKAFCNINYNKDNSSRFLRFNENRSAKVEDVLWLTQNENQASTGYGIVATHAKDQKTVHGEAKLLDYLMAARVITKKDKKNHDFGISKKLCPLCENLLKQLETIIGVTIAKPKAHDVYFDHWGEPLFLEDDPENGKKPNRKTFGYLRVYEENEKKESFTYFSSFEDYQKKIKKISSKKGVVVEGYLNRDHQLVKEIKRLFNPKHDELSQKNSDNGCISHSSPEKRKIVQKSLHPSKESIKQLSSLIADEIKEARNNGVGEEELEEIIAKRLTTSLTGKHCLFNKQERNQTALTSVKKETKMPSNFPSGASP